VTIAANDFADVMRGVWPGSRSAAMPKLSPEEAARIWATPPDGLFHRLLSAGVLKMSGEHGAVPPADPRAIAYADFPPPDKSEKAWKEQLGLFTSSEQAIFAIVLDALARPMFPGDHDVSFEGVTFAAPAFKNVDLSRCLFRDVNLDQLVVENVTWGSRRLIFWRRATLHDESYANTTQDFARMLSVYSTIKGRYDAIKDTRAADAFYRSEMEMERLAGSPLRLLHKYLNAYNTSLALPLFWLLLFCFAIFPLLYWSTGTVSSFGDGIIHTLFLASFTKLAAAAKTTVAGLALQTLQLATFGILVFSVVSIFKRRLRWS
jgi:hypothetical protein